ncbi:MAG: HAD family hydrolase [Acetivibrio sp.]
MYQNYIFDLYGTLVDIHTDEEMDSLWEAMARFYSYNEAPYTKEELKEAYFSKIQREEEEILKSHVFSEIQIEKVFEDLYQKKGKEPSEEQILYTAQMFRAISIQQEALYDGAKELIKELKEKGKKVFLLTNAQRIFTEYELKMLGIWDCFDDIFISSQVGYKKPSKGFFEALFQKHKLIKEESIMIGNDVSADIQGANQMGIDSVYLHSNLSSDMVVRPKSTYSIMPSDLFELKQILL